MDCNLHLLAHPVRELSKGKVRMLFLVPDDALLLLHAELGALLDSREARSRNDAKSRD